MLNPRPEGLGDRHLSELYPLSCLAWLDMSGAETPASVTLLVIETHKPSHQDKAPVSIRGLAVTNKWKFGITAEETNWKGV